MLARVVRGTLRTLGARLGFGHTQPPLAEVLKTAIEHESAMYSEDQSISRFLQRSDFQLTDSETKVSVSLKRTHLQYEVEVRFEAQGADLESEEEEEEDNSVDFRVTIRRERAAMLFNCLSKSGEVIVISVLYTDDFDRDLDNEKVYAGPSYPTLDPRLRSLFEQFLSSFGVTPELAAFIESYSIDKEQRLYIQWLIELRQTVKQSKANP